MPIGCSGELASIEFYSSSVLRYGNELLEFNIDVRMFSLSGDAQIEWQGMEEAGQTS